MDIILIIILVVAFYDIFVKRRKGDSSDQYSDNDKDKPYGLPWMGGTLKEKESNRRSKY